MDPKLAAVLDEIEDYLEDREDADQPAGADYPIPNEAMRLLIELRAARGKSSW